MIKEIQTVWFADEKKFNSPYKGIVYDSIGDLYIYPDEPKLIYHTRKQEIVIERIERVYLKRSAFPWLTYLLANLPIIAILLPTNIYTALYLFGMVLIGNIAGLCCGWLFSYWTVVVYIDGNGKKRNAHFFDGRFNGWSGILGGTRKLYKEVIEIEGLIAEKS